MNVFEITGAYRQLEALLELDPDDETLQAEINRIDDAAENKAENIAYLIRNREAALAGMALAKSELEGRMRNAAADVDRLKEKLHGLLAATGKRKVQGRFVTVSVVNNKAAVIVDNPGLLPPQFLRMVPPIPAVIEPDKAKLYEAMREGEIIAGARLVPSERIVIK